MQYDQKIDALVVLSNPTRRKIRDILRRKGELTLTEISQILGISEQNAYHHLTKMLEAGIVVKRKEKIGGRLVTLYSLSEFYNDLFKEPKPDLLPIYALSIVYLVLLILIVAIPDVIMSLYSRLGVKSVETAFGIVFFGFLTTVVILLYYHIPDIIRKVREWFSKLLNKHAKS